MRRFALLLVIVVATGTIFLLSRTDRERSSLKREMQALGEEVESRAEPVAKEIERLGQSAKAVGSETYRFFDIPRDALAAYESFARARANYNFGVARSYAAGPALEQTQAAMVAHQRASSGARDRVYLSTAAQKQLGQQPDVEMIEAARELGIKGAGTVGIEILEAKLSDSGDQLKIEARCTLHQGSHIDSQHQRATVMRLGDSWKVVDFQAGSP